MERESSYAQDILLQEFSMRKSKNSMYSMRAFARDLGIGKTTLSDVLAAKRKLSRSGVFKIAEKLHLAPSQVDAMLGELKRKRIPKASEELERLLLEEDTFRLIADWYYLAIINLVKIKKIKQVNAVSIISDRLGILAVEAETALKRLLRMNLLYAKNGILFRTEKPLTTTTNIPSAAIKKYHKDNLALAQKSLVNDEVDRREFCSITMAIDPKKLPEAQEILKKTRRKIAKVLETQNPKEVYTLSFQLFPLTGRASSGGSN